MDTGRDQSMPEAQRNENHKARSIVTEETIDRRQVATKAEGLGLSRITQERARNSATASPAIMAWVFVAVSCNGLATEGLKRHG